MAGVVWKTLPVVDLEMETLLVMDLEVQSTEFKLIELTKLTFYIPPDTK